MAYEIHLEREEPFSESEWRDAVAGEPGLELRGASFAEVTNPVTGEVIRIPTSPLDALGAEFGLFFHSGRVSFLARSGFEPGTELWALAFRLADRLGARVVGDDGEIYTES